ncbi:MAG: Rnase Y domain-containing protein, partial [bacterium]|nr:Rnase Y domain-containing protein [bacterium]
MADGIIYQVAIVVVVVALGFYISWTMAKRSAARSIEEAKEHASRITGEADNKAALLRKEIALEAREERMKFKSELEQEYNAKSKELDKQEAALTESEGNLAKKIEFLDVRDRELANREGNLHTREKGIGLREAELEKIILTQNERLQKIAQMSPEEAKKLLMDNMMSEARLEAAQYIKEIKEKAEREADKEAKEVILSSIYRCAAEHTVETTVSVVNLPGDEMKGRIIGREGRNIRSFETETGIDVIVDDTPEAVILSGFDPVRREVARMALEKLITDGRIHPTRIEEVVEK